MENKTIPVIFRDKFPFSGEPKRNLTYLEFLQTCKVIRMLYGTESAKKYLTDNLGVYYNLDNT